MARMPSDDLPMRKAGDFLQFASCQTTRGRVVLLHLVKLFVLVLLV